MSAEPTSQPSSLACYMRVSGDEQKRKGTIETQRDVLTRYLGKETITPYGWYEDEAVSGYFVAFPNRPDGARLLADIRAGHVDTVLVRKLDRFGRNAREILNAVHEIEQAGARLISLKENVDTRTSAGRFFLTVLAGVAELERDMIVERSEEGIDRHLHEGGWCGGQRPYGYVVVGREEDARLVISRTLLDTPDGPLGMSEADVVEEVYRLATAMRWSLVRIADHLTALGVPTATRWRANRVHALLTNPVYKGLATYGKRTAKGKKGQHGAPDGLLIVPVSAIVSPEVWHAAHDALHTRQRFATRNAHHAYLLRGLVVCGLCGRVYRGVEYAIGNHDGRTGRYYVCNGKSGAVKLFGNAEANARRCPSTAVRADGPEGLETLIWADVADYIHNPGPVLDRLAAQLDAQAAQAPAVRAAVVLAEKQLAAKVGEQDAVLALYRRGRIDQATLDRQLDAIQAEEQGLREQVAQAQAEARSLAAREDRLRGAGVLLRRLQVRLDTEALTPQLQRELVEALVEQVVTGVKADGTSRTGRPKVKPDPTVTYCFDDPAERATAGPAMPSVVSAARSNGRPTACSSSTISFRCRAASPPAIP